MKYVKIKTSELNEICELAKRLIKVANGDSAVEDKAYNILLLSQSPLQERDPQNF